MNSIESIFSLLSSSHSFKIDDATFCTINKIWLIKKNMIIIYLYRIQLGLLSKKNMTKGNAASDFVVESGCMCNVHVAKTKPDQMS